MRDKTPFLQKAVAEEPAVITAESSISHEPFRTYALSVGDDAWMKNYLRSSFDYADLIIFPGGGDVHPTLYAEPVGAYTHASRVVDERQIEVFKRALKAGKKMLGICRGLQLLHVMAGGKLVQDVHHPHTHGLITYDGKGLITNSLHHQQVMFEGLKEGIDYQLLAWADKPSPYHLGGDNKDYNFDEDYKDPEVVYYPKINAIGIQGHPEFSSMPEATRVWLKDQIRKYLYAL